MEIDISTCGLMIKFVIISEEILLRLLFAVVTPRLKRQLSTGQMTMVASLFGLGRPRICPDIFAKDTTAEMPGSSDPNLD